MDSNKIVSRLLLTIIYLIIVIIVVGGITRLTNSGLSIPAWEITEIFPPMSDDSWSEKFNNYKNYPDYKGQTKEEYKLIYWWEYIHRIIGRIIGIIAIIPFFYFMYKKYLSREQKISYSFILLLIIFQGVIGWMMVKSGLNPEVYEMSKGVSPFWLLAHLGMAFLTLSYTFFNYLRINKQYLINYNPSAANFAKIIVILIFIQILLGALMAGFKAGIIYPTFPLMNGEFYPSRIIMFDFSNPDFIHFSHRWFPFALFILIISFYFKNRRHFSINQKGVFRIFIYIFIFQIFLGIVTVLNPVIPFNWEVDKVCIAVMHQFSAIIILLSAISLLFTFNSK